VSVWQTIPKRGGGGMVRLRVRQAKRIELEVRVDGVSVTISLAPVDARRLQGALGTACTVQAGLQCPACPSGQPSPPTTT